MVAAQSVAVIVVDEVLVFAGAVRLELWTVKKAGRRRFVWRELGLKMMRRRRLTVCSLRSVGQLVA